MTALPAIRREVVVAAPADTAFALFTAHIGAWWPAEEYSVFGGAGTVAFEGRELVERRGADRTVWAEVVAWDPPHAFGLSWHPGSEPAKETDLAVTFTPVGDGRTRVRIEHRGWERLADPAAAREEYGHGWVEVLDSYRARVEPTAEPVQNVAEPAGPGEVAAGPGEAAEVVTGSAVPGEVVTGPAVPGDAAEVVTGSAVPGEVVARPAVPGDAAEVVAGPAGPGEVAAGPGDDGEGAAEVAWFALVHRPGPALDAGGSVFAHPDFAEHVAFLRRMAARGALVAAGPLADEDGTGMTVLRLAGADAAEQALALATRDDRSVASGLLTVTIRPWDVRFTATPPRRS